MLQYKKLKGIGILISVKVNSNTVLGLCPITPDVYTMNSDEKIILIYFGSFPCQRCYMKLFNDKNSAMPISFDQILNSRHFNSVYKEENVYGDREIKDYMKDNAQSHY
jgi:hypothetical protein